MTVVDKNSEDRAAFNHEMMICLKKNACKGVQKLFERMQSRGISPDHRSYNLLIASYLRENDMISAENALALMKGDVGTDVHVYNKFMAHFASKGQVHQAKALFVQLEKDEIEPDKSTYAQYINALTAGRQLDEALAVIAGPVVKHKHVLRFDSYVSLVKALVAAGRQGVYDSPSFLIMYHVFNPSLFTVMFHALFSTHIRIDSFFYIIADYCLYISR